jgi:mercuric reductase
MAKQEEYHLKIQGMTCASCANHVTEALSNVDRVKKTEIPDWSNGIAIVHTQNGIQEIGLIQAVENTGYKAKILEPPESKDPSAGKDAEARKNGSKVAYDLIVIGTGAAGMGAAIKAAEMGFNSCLSSKLYHYIISVGYLPCNQFDFLY